MKFYHSVYYIIINVYHNNTFHTVIVYTYTAIPLRTILNDLTLMRIALSGASFGTYPNNVDKLQYHLNCIRALKFFHTWIIVTGDRNKLIQI